MMFKEISTIGTIAILLTTTALAITSIPSYQPTLAQSNATQEANQTGEQMQSGMNQTGERGQSMLNQTGEGAQSLMNQTGEALQNINPFK
jgi:phosphopantothenoylcysteine synthetase/decarboxylase